MRSPYCAGKPWKVGIWTRKSLLKASSTTLSLVALREEASTPTAETTARPIISAEAVAPVRRGLRSAFSPARRPAVPKTRPKTDRHATSTGLPSTGASTAVVITQMTAPAPIQIASVPGAPVRPAAASATPRTMAIEPSSRRRPIPFSCTTRSSRIAATGGTLAARRAGTKAATIVTRMPVT